MVIHTPSNTAELWKGLSDLPQGIAAVVLSFFIFRFPTKQPQKRAAWGLLFLLTGIASFLGGAVHTFVLGGGVTEAIWTALYPILYLTVILLFFCIVGYTSDGLRPTAEEKRLIGLAGLFFCLFSVCMLYLKIDLDIFIFVGFGGLLMIPIVISAVKAGKKAALIYAASVILAFALLFQALRPIFAYGVVVAHGLITAALFVVFFAAKRDCKGTDD